MKFDLIRPCKDCPFRSDIPGFLTKARVREIIDGITRGQATFTCHKTNEFDDSGTVETKDSQHCAGALIFLERLDQPNQMMRWMERIGVYDRSKLDMESPVHTAKSMVAAQRSKAGAA
jgi:hypothetical protein